MIIIIEGCDFSGKSTLAQRLSNDLNIGILRSWKPKSLKDALQWTSKVLSFDATSIICDRSPLISEPIYGSIVRSRPNITKRQASHLLQVVSPVVIHCDPGKDHILSMNNDQMAGVKENAERIYDAYKDPMCRWAFFKYDFRLGEPIYEELLTYLKLPIKDPLRHHSLSFDFEVASIIDFHRKFNLPLPSNTSVLKGELLDYRYNFLEEELHEFKQASLKGSLVDSFDALLDLVYVAKGTALMMGIDSDQWALGFDAVQHANMTKVRAPDAEASKRKSSLDVIKPKNFVGPEKTLRDILNLGDEQ